MEIRKGVRAEGDPRERGRERRGRSCPHRHHASPPPSLIAVATGPAEPRHRHWGHRAVTESSHEREVTRERELREEGEFCPTVVATVASWELCRRSSVAIHGVVGVHRHREEERHADGEPTGERKRHRVCCEPAIVTLIVTCHRRG
ncbi:hypothetical protein AHAS_Ahas16G0185000 [Arachis hypogaea]